MTIIGLGIGLWISIEVLAWHGKELSDHDTPVNSENGINKCKWNGYEYTRYNFED